MARRRTNPDFLTGVPELLLLRLLSRKPMHGYAVVQEITIATGGDLKFGEGSIYPILHRLEEEGKLSTKRTEHNGRDRVIYRTTEKGLAQLAESLSLWQKVVRGVDAAFEGLEPNRGSHAQDSVA